MTITRETIVNEESTAKITITKKATLESWKQLKEKAMKKAKRSGLRSSMYFTSRIIQFDIISGKTYIFRLSGVK